MTTLRRAATNAPMYSTARTGARPPHTSSLAAECPAIAGERRDADERGDLLPIQLPELRQVGEQGAAHDGADAGHGAEQVLFDTPDRALLDGVIEIAIDGRDASLERADVLRDVPTDRRARVLQSIPLGGHHVKELSPPRHQGRKVLAPGIWERPRRGLHPLGKERDEVGIETGRLGELPSGSREVADLARIRHDHRECRRGQGDDERGFVSAGRFEDDERRRQGPHAVDGGSDAPSLIRRRP